MIFVDEETVKRTAAIIGPASAAARAIEEATRRRANGDEVAFLKDRGVLYVASRKPTDQTEPAGEAS